MTLDELCRVRLPFSASAVAMDARTVALFAPEFSAIACVDLKHAVGASKAKITALIPCRELAPVLALRQSRLAIGGSRSTTIIDLVNGAPAVTLSPRSGLPRSRLVTALDWSQDLLAVGTEAGSIQLWDPRLPVGPVALLPAPTAYKCGVVKFSRFAETSIASVNGDVVSVWDLRTLRAPTRQQMAAPGKSAIRYIEWIGPQSTDLVVGTAKDGVFRCNTDGIFSQIFSSSFSSICAIPVSSSSALLAVQTAAHTVHLVDPLSGSVTESIEIDSTFVESIGYLDEPRAICMYLPQTSSLLVHSVAGATSYDHSLIQSESSPRLHPVDSTEQFTDDLKALQASFTLLARRLRRLTLDAELITGDACGLEITIPSSDADRFKLKAVMTVTSGVVPELEWETWWVQASIDPFDVISLPDALEIQTSYFGKICADSIVAGDIGSAVEVFRSVKALIASLEEEPGLKQQSVDEYSAVSTPSSSATCVADDARLPFPATCGVCWSPKGDLFRFHSLKGLSPYPKNRERLTMSNFFSLKEVIDVSAAQSTGVVGDSSAGVAVRLNEFSPYVEPVFTDTALDDDGLDQEYNQRVFTDQCVQFLPAHVFEAAVEDHWFASVAPIVDFRLSPSIMARELGEFTQQFVRNDAAIELVKDVYFLTSELVSSSEKNGGLDVVKQMIIEDRLRKMYTSEQSQAVAVIGAMLIKRRMKFLADKNFFQTLLILIHDHAVLFQRLGCFEASRVLENIQSEYVPSLPLLADQGTSLLVPKGRKPSCSVCTLPVHGIGRFCSQCGHGGHLKHVTAITVCPVGGCGCHCNQKSVPTRTTLPASVFVSET